MTRLPAAVLALLFAGGFGVAALAQASFDLVSRSEFRVCADPNNLPFSNDKREGFENKIDDIMANDLHEPVRYTWYPGSTGFVRRTLLADRCDVVMGTVAGGEMMDDTNP